MITQKTAQKAIEQYRQYIDRYGIRRDFGYSEMSAVYDAAALTEGNFKWNLLTSALMYGYMKGYKRALKDSRKNAKAPGTAATVTGAGTGSAATDTREIM